MLKSKDQKVGPRFPVRAVLNNKTFTIFTATVKIRFINFLNIIIVKLEL